MNTEFLDEAYNALPDHLKFHPETQLTLAFSESCVVMANPEYAAMIYRKENKKWEDLTYHDHRRYMEGTL